MKLNDIYSFVTMKDDILGLSVRKKLKIMHAFLQIADSSLPIFSKDKVDDLSDWCLLSRHKFSNGRFYVTFHRPSDGLYISIFYEDFDCMKFNFSVGFLDE